MKNATLSPSGTGMEVEVNRLRPNAWNKTRPLDSAFTASIAQQGVLSPLTVREVEADEEGRDLEIICGERRWQGAVAVGQERIPVLVRNMDDQEAQLCTLIENTHRENMSPWQEAQLVGDLLGRPDWDIATAAAATGWSESMIRRRAKLLDLSPSWRKAIEENTLVGWSTAHYETLTIFDEKRQESLFKEMEYRANGMTLQDLREEISSSSESLKAAPFDLEDVTLFPRAGACTSCSMRSDAQADLFGSVQGTVKEKAQCLVPSCFKKKLSAHTKRKEALLLEKHPDAIRVAKDHGGGGKGTLKPYEYSPAKKGDKGAVSAIQVASDGQVSHTYVKVAKTAGQVEKAPKDKAKEAERMRHARVDSLAMEKLVGVIRDAKGDLAFTAEALPVLVQFCLIRGLPVEVGKGEVDRIRAFAKKPVTVAELWKAAQYHMYQELDIIKWNIKRELERAEKNSEVQLFAWMVDADFSVLVKEAETELAQALPADVAADAGEGADLEDDDE